MPSTNASSPWYREPWPWLLMAGPAAVIAAGAYTTVLAVRSDDGLVAEDYYKQGMTINREIAREQHAREKNIHARMEFSGNRVSAVVDAATPLSPTLRLRIVHPTRAGDDRSVLLVAGAQHAYSGDLPPFGNEARRLILEDTAATWRITGNLARNGVNAQLVP
jgi:hypothetical protein